MVEVIYCEPDQAKIAVILPSFMIILESLQEQVCVLTSLTSGALHCRTLRPPEKDGEGTPLSGSFEIVNRQDGDHAHILPIRTGDLSFSAAD